MRSIFLKSIENLLRGRSQNIVYFMNLVEFVVTREQWKQRQDLEEDTSDAPNVHFIPIVAICHETLGCTVPSSRDILCQRRFGVETSATAEISQLDCITR